MPRLRALQDERRDPASSAQVPEPAPLGPPPSTGGTTEPNDEPYGDMFFRSYGVNPFIDTEDDNLSTFGLDVDTGAYTLARGYIEGGHLPPPEAIRVEEMVNFFDYRDPVPSSGDFAITLEGAPTPFAEGPRYRLLRFAIRGREVTAADRKPATLVFVVDVSGSMERENRLGLVQRSLGLLLDELRGDDRVGLVVYGDHGRVLLEPSGDLEAIRSAIDRLVPGGSTNAEEGLVLGYELAERNFRAGAINRVVLCSDGVANVGRTGPDSILTRIGAAAERGIELTTIGFGMGNYNDVLMEQLADRGDGSYAYVDSLDEARRVFVEKLTGTLQTIAREARAQVEFDARSVSRYRLLGYENRDIADERFRDDTVDAGEIGAGHSVTALYEVKLTEEARPHDAVATLRLRYRTVATGEVVETAATLRLGDLAASWESASPALRLASLVAEHAEILRHSYWARGSELEDVFRRAQSVSGEFPGDVEVAELVGLIGRAARLEGERTESLAFDDR
jgi:Ca-activated chloride channel family protein